MKKEKKEYQCIECRTDCLKLMDDQQTLYCPFCDEYFTKEICEVKK